MEEMVAGRSICSSLQVELVPPALFLQCDPALILGGSGVLADPLRIGEEFEKAWFAYFCRSGRRETNLEEFAHEVEGWLPVLLKVVLPRLSGSLLADVVHRKKVTVGGLDGWSLRIGFGLRYWILSLVLGVDVALLKLGIPLLSILRRFFLVLLIRMFTFFCC